MYEVTYIGLAVKDSDRSGRFCRDVLGWTLFFAGPDGERQELIQEAAL
ncbi:VOC family protein [Anaeroselena agilis]|uniref:Uncharacterized protein n=1 Tax=Anaeroselena agilis TaxID=3063788 RepID=A0ABU3NVM6_9FIRM|nr:hypothetical protein [Selenomonadales bacterium 4137-cl]